MKIPPHLANNMRPDLVSDLDTYNIFNPLVILRSLNDLIDFPRSG